MLFSMFWDDITWCINGNECDVVSCRRHPANMIDNTGVHSYAEFLGTDECPRTESGKKKEEK